MNNSKREMMKPERSNRPEKLAILSPLRDKALPEKDRIALEIMKQMDRDAGGQR